MFVASRPDMALARLVGFLDGISEVVQEDLQQLQPELLVQRLIASLAIGEAAASAAASEIVRSLTGMVGLVELLGSQVQELRQRRDVATALAFMRM